MAMNTVLQLKKRIRVFVLFLAGYLILSLLWSGPERIAEHLFVGGVSAFGLALLWPAMLQAVYRVTERLARR